VALNFPNSPTTGQVFGKWTYDGAQWMLTGGGGGAGSDGYTFVQATVPTATSDGQTWFNTETGDSFVWIIDADTSQWVQTAPGGGGGGGSGFTFVQDTAPTPVEEGDTWFDLSDAASGGTSWVAVSEIPGAAGPLNWVQFAPGSGAGVLDPRYPWGRVATAFGSVSDSAVTAGQIVVTTSAMLIAGRRYKITANVNISAPPTATHTWDIRVNGSSIQAVSITIPASALAVIPLIGLWSAVSTASVPVTLVSQVASTYVGSFSRQAVLVVEDIGPH
jgi:hypothetical protein